MREARAKLVILALLGAAHMMTAPSVLYATLTVVGAVLVIEWAHFRRFAWWFAILLALVAVVGLVVWRLAASAEASRVVHDLVRLLSLAAVTLTIASTMSVMETAAVVRWLRLPMGIAIAMAVCIRFVPVAVNEARQVAFTRRQRGQTAIRSIRRFGVVGAASRSVAPLVIGVLRRTEAIVLAVHLQDLSGRIARFEFARPSKLDVAMLCATGAVLVYALVLAV